MYELKKMKSYVRVNLLGLGPRLMKKEFTGPRSPKSWETLYQNRVLYPRRQSLSWSPFWGLHTSCHFVNSHDNVKFPFKWICKSWDFEIHLTGWWSDSVMRLLLYLQRHLGAFGTWATTTTTTTTTTTNPATGYCPSGHPLPGGQCEGVDQPQNICEGNIK